MFISSATKTLSAAGENDQVNHYPHCYQHAWNMETQLYVYVGLN